MPHLDFERFLRIPNFFYKSVGIIINKDEAIGIVERRFINFLFYVGLLNMNANLLGEMVFATLAFHAGNLVDAVMTLSYIGFVFMGDFKMLYVYWKKHELDECLNELYAIFPKNQQTARAYNMRQYLRKCTLIMVAFSALYMLLIWTYNLYALLQYLICDKWFHWRVVGQQLPYSVYIPWQWQGHWSFYLLYASQSFAGYTSAAGQIANDLLLCATATQVVMHYDFMAKWIENCAISDIDFEKNFRFLHNFVAYHQRILKLSKQLNSVFGISMFFNFLTSSFVICFVGFQMSIGVSTDTMIKLCLFFLSSMAQVYLICYYGQELMNASEYIALAIYQHNWQAADLRYQKMLLIIAGRSQEPAMLKATSFLLVSQRTMTDQFKVFNLFNFLSYYKSATSFLLFYVPCMRSDYEVRDIKPLSYDMSNMI